MLFPFQKSIFCFSLFDLCLSSGDSNVRVCVRNGFHLVSLHGLLAASHLFSHVQISSWHVAQQTTAWPIKVIWKLFRGCYLTFCCLLVQQLWSASVVSGGVEVRLTEAFLSAESRDLVKKTNPSLPHFYWLIPFWLIFFCSEITESYLFYLFGL